MVWLSVIFSLYFFDKHVAVAAIVELSHVPASIIIIFFDKKQELN